MNTKHPNLDKIISMIETKQNGLRKLVDEYDVLKIQQKSEHSVSEITHENEIKISAYLMALKDLEFITFSLWRDAEKENTALFEEAFFAYREVETE